MIVNDAWSPAISADRAVARARPLRTLAYVIYTSGATAFSRLESRVAAIAAILEVCVTAGLVALHLKK
jgi:hypothetical protein